MTRRLASAERASLLVMLLASAASAQVTAPPIRLADQTPPTPATYGERQAQPALEIPCRLDSLDDEFLRRYREATDDDSRIRLVDWCEAGGLDRCAEFALRNWLYRNRQAVETPVYQRQFQAWRKYDGQRASPYTFRLPVEGEWHVLVDSTKHHQQKHWSIWAYDLVKLEAGTWYAGDALDRHFSWRQPVLAVSDGMVIGVADHFSDREVGRPAPIGESNYLLLDCGGGVFAFYGHLQQGSARVKRGDTVQSGDILALVGNSGASHAPHLHFTMLDGDGFSLRGRYRFEILTTAGWYAVEGIDLAEGWQVRSSIIPDNRN